MALLFFFRSAIAALDASTIVLLGGISFVRPRRRLSSAPTACDRGRRAQTMSRLAAQRPPKARPLHRRARRHAGCVGSNDWPPCLCLLARIDGQVHVDVHGSCDDRINLYPAAPFRLATLLNAWMIAREGWGSSFGRQIGGVPICDADPQPHIRPAQRARRSVRTVVPCLIIYWLGSHLAAPGRARGNAKARSPASAPRRRS